MRLTLTTDDGEVINAWDGVEGKVGTPLANSIMGQEIAYEIVKHKAKTNRVVTEVVNTDLNSHACRHCGMTINQGGHTPGCHYGPGQHRTRAKINKSRREEGEFVPMTLDHVLVLRHGEEVYLRPARGGDTLLRCRVSSQVKRWKREADRFEVAVKHGMYDNARLDNSDLPRMFRKVGP